MPAANNTVLTVDDHLGVHGIDRVLIGINDAGQPALWHRNVTPHLRLTGDTGKGKSVAANTVIAHAIHHGDIVIHLDPKPGGAGWVASYAHCAVTPAGHHDALEWVVAEMRARQWLRLAHDNGDGTTGCADIYSLPTHLPRVALIIEEMGAVVGEMAMLPTEDEDEKDAIKRVARNVTRLTLLVTQGRTEGIHVVGLTQYPTVEATFTGMTKMGGAITANFNARVHLDANDISLRAVFNKGDGISDQIIRFIRAGRRGRGAYLHLDPADEERVRLIQVWDIRRELLARLALTTPRPPADAYLAGPPPPSFDPIVKEFGPDE